MDFFKNLLDNWAGLLPEGIRDQGLVLFFGAVLLVLLPIAWFQRRNLQALVVRSFKPAAPPPVLDEDLGSYPPCENLPDVRRLTVEGVPARLRLVVVAPLGKGDQVSENQVEELLNQVLWGLGGLLAQDRPRIRIWPPQLSIHGFPAMFQRNLKKPEADDQSSHWVLVAGSTPPRPRSALLGLALYTDVATNIGRLNMEARDWANALQFQTLEQPKGYEDYSAPRSDQTPLPTPRENDHPVSMPNRQQDGGSI
jgi:hypothetical protein